MSEGGGAAAPEDEVTKLQRYIDEREQELRGIRGQIAELERALDAEVFTPVSRRVKTVEAAESELERLRTEKASAEQLLQQYNQRLLLLQQGGAGGCADCGCSGACNVRALFI
jgi:chromosome segregation ATPase